MPKSPLSDTVISWYSAWEEGAKDARAGKPSTDCPYKAHDYNFVTWMNGWAWAAYRMATEALVKQVLADDYEEI